jgi:hypothetical protein
MSATRRSPFRTVQARPDPEVKTVGVAAGVALSLVVMAIGALFALDSSSTAGAFIAVLAGPAVLILAGVLCRRLDFVLGTLGAVAFVLVVFGGCIASCSETWRQMGS